MIETIRIIFWLIVVGSVIALIADRFKKKGKSFPLVWVVTAILLILMAVGIGSCREKSRKDEAKNKANREAALERARTNPPVVIKVGKTPTLHQCTNYVDKVVVVTIKSHDFYWYCKGGRFLVIPPKGKPFIDTPGVDITTHRGPGEWKWQPLDSTSTGVQVWD